MPHLVLLPFLLTSLMLLRPSVGDLTCEGGRGEGDKWFDGCQWCVCQSGRPVCSPRECSKYVAHVPPCENLNSRWHDGCYFCTCGISGIECVADWACVVHSQSASGQNFLSRGKCMEPMDYRCICGVDGVPSCSAEVIDRSTYQSTLIALNLTNPRSLRLARLSGNNFPSVDHRPTSGGYPILSRKKRRSRGHSRQDRDQRLQDAEGRNAQPTDALSWLGTIDDEAANSILIEEENEYFDRERKGRRSHNLRRHGKSRHGSSSTPSSLLIATDNRCRFGARWYGGSLRCYCDISGSITCGDPSFVATRIDGFRIESKACEVGHVWEEVKSCRSCECPMTSLVICQRSPTCPLPYLIRPKGDESYRTGEFRGGEEVRWDRKSGQKVTDLFLDLEDSDDTVTNILDGSGGHGKTRNSGTDVIIEDPEDEGDEILIDLNKSKPTLVIESDDSLEIDVDDEDDIEIDLDGLKEGQHKATKRGQGKFPDDSRYTTVVTIRECKPGSRWRDGCLLCHCTRKGKKVCDDRKCPKFNKAVEYPPGLVQEGGVHFEPVKEGDRQSESFRPMQRPPVVQGTVRYLPIHPKSWDVQGQCGKFQFGQRYWKKCNLCVCTRKGPRCTAKSCG